MTEAPKGHVKIARKAFDSDEWWLERRALSKWEAWVDMIQLAQWAPRNLVTTKFGTVRLERGEFVLSLSQMAKRWRWSVRSVRTFTESPVFSTRVSTREVTQAGTVYLIVNYDRYQSTPEASDTASDTPDDRPSTYLRQATDTRTSSKAVKQRKALSPSGDERRVLDHYLSRHPKRRLTDKSIAVVRKALSFGYSPEELCEAIDGNADDRWHSEKAKHELSYVLRDAEKIDGFRLVAEPVQAIVDDDGCLTAYGERLTRPANV